MMKTISKIIEDMGVPKMLEKTALLEKHLNKKEMQVIRNCFILILTGDTSNYLLQEVVKDKPDIPTVKKLIDELDESEYKRMNDKIAELDRVTDEINIEFDF